MSGASAPLVVAALSEEVTALSHRLEARVAGMAGRQRYETGTLSGWPITLAATGDGPIHAERGLAALLSAIEPSEVWVVGFSGGLSPDLEVGQLVAASEVRSSGGGEPVTPSLPSWPGAKPGTVLTVDRIASSAREKHRLWEELGAPSPAVVDLESAVFARTAQRAGVRWRVLRAVSDPADQDLPLDFERFRDAEGGLSRSRIARHAVTRPAVMRGLFALRTAATACAERLATAVESELGRQGDAA